MAAYRKISITFWSDPFVQTLTPEGKYFYLYLMTNTKTSQCGIYEITINHMSFETGYNNATIEKLLKQFQQNGRVKYSKETNEIALKNWPKYNLSESPKVKACVSNELKSIKNPALIEYLYSINTSSQETKEETKEEKETKPQEAEVWPSFDDFWDLYDKKVDRNKCEKKYKKIEQGAREKIMHHLGMYVAATPDKQFRKNPETYLNNQSWENEVIKSETNGHIKTNNGTIKPTGTGKTFSGDYSQPL